MIVVFDLDGTLYNSRKMIDSATVDKIVEIQKSGNCVGIVTGRYYAELDEVIKMLKLEEYHGFICTSNGLEIHDYDDGEHKVFDQISHDRTRQLIERGLKRNLICYTHEDKAYHFYGARRFKKAQALALKFPVNTPIFHDISNMVIEDEIVLNKDNYDKICFFGSKKNLSLFTHEVNQMYSEYIFYPVRENITEICKKEVGKYQAVAYLCKKKNVMMDDVVAFGDSGNDIPLFQHAGNSICMKNGMESAKQAAKIVSKYTNDQRGVLKELNRLFESNEK